jgi:hypothetical protein
MERKIQEGHMCNLALPLNFTQRSNKNLRPSLPLDRRIRAAIRGEGFARNVREKLGRLQWSVCVRESCYEAQGRRMVEITVGRRKGTR